MQHTMAQVATIEVEPAPDDKIYPAHKLALLVEELAAEGVSARDALAGVGVGEESLASPDTRVSLNQMIACHRNALRLSLDPSFAFRLGLRCHVPAHGMYGFALLSSTDFRHTIEFALRYSQLAAAPVHLSFSEDAKNGVWTIEPMAHPAMTPQLYRYLVDLHLGTHLALHRDVMDPAFHAEKIHVTFGSQEDSETYERMLGCPVMFGQKYNQIYFDVAWLNRRPELGNEATFNTVRKICDELIEDLRLRIGLAGQVRQFLLANLMRPVRLGEVAKQLDMSARTLRRRLQDENTTYRQLVDDLRRDLAIKYLRETVMTVDDIGYALGFSEPTNFRQAFRRWTQATPGDFRTGVRAA